MPALDTTVGGASSNAYCDLTYIATIVDTLYPQPDAWLALSSENQSRLVIQMTQRLDQDNRWFRGTRVNQAPTQALEYPRAQAPVPGSDGGDGYGYGFGYAGGVSFELTTVIPNRVKQAVAVGVVEWAKFVAAGYDLSTSGVSNLAGMSLGTTLQASFDNKKSELGPLEQMMAYLVRPIMGNLMLSPQLRTVRG